MSYTVTFRTHVPVAGLIEPGKAVLTPSRAAKALRALADRIDADPSLAREIFSTVDDAEMEDLWVLRRLDEPNCIRKADAGWIRTSPRDIRLEDMLSGADILALTSRSMPGAIWSRPENIGGTPILLSLSSEQGSAGRLDLRDWLAWASDESILAGINANWSFIDPVQRALMAHDEEDLFGDSDPLKTDVNLRLIAKERLVSAHVAPEDRPGMLSFLKDLRPHLFDEPAAGLEM